MSEKKNYSSKSGIESHLTHHSCDKLMNSWIAMPRESLERKIQEKKKKDKDKKKKKKKKKKDQPEVEKHD